MPCHPANPLQPLRPNQRLLSPDQRGVIRLHRRNQRRKRGPACGIHYGSLISATRVEKRRTERPCISGCLSVLIIRTYTTQVLQQPQTSAPLGVLTVSVRMVFAVVRIPLMRPAWYIMSFIPLSTDICIFGRIQQASRFVRRLYCIWSKLQIPSSASLHRSQRVVVNPPMHVKDSVLQRHVSHLPSLSM